MYIGKIACMIMMLLYLLLGHLTVSMAQGTAVKSQDFRKVKNKALSVGDFVPEIYFNNVLNYKDRKFKLSDFAGKLVIIDMWSTLCATCISGFPNLVSLQNKFDGKIQVLLADTDRKYDTKEKILKVIKNVELRNGIKMNLPVPVFDSILNEYFPHLVVPHQIWIDGNRKVIAITSGAETTETNILKFLNGSAPALSLKDDWIFNKQKPLLVDGNGGGKSEDFVYRAIFTPFKRQISTVTEGIRINENNELTGFYLINHKLINLVKEAYSELVREFGNERTILDVRELSKYEPGADSINSYCYDISIPPIPIPPNSYNYFRSYLKDDLKRCFGVIAKKESKRIACYVIKNTSFIPGTKYHTSSQNLIIANGPRYFHKKTLTDIFRSLMDRHKIVICDETNIQEDVDIDFPNELFIDDIDNVFQYFMKIGLDVRVENRELDVLIITDRSNS